MADTNLERTLAALPPDLQREVEDFAAFLLARRSVTEDSVTRGSLTEGGATGASHPLAALAGAWRDEPLTDEELLPKRSPGRDVDL